MTTTLDMERNNIRTTAEYLPLHISAAETALRKARNCLDVGARLGRFDYDLLKVKRDLEEMMRLVDGMREKENEEKAFAAE